MPLLRHLPQASLHFPPHPLSFPPLSLASGRFREKASILHKIAKKKCQVDENERQNGAANHVGECRETWSSALPGVRGGERRAGPSAPLTPHRHGRLQLSPVLSVGQAKSRAPGGYRPWVDTLSPALGELQEEEKESMRNLK